jgi:hypothetical protein
MGRGIDVLFVLYTLEVVLYLTVQIKVAQMFLVNETGARNLIFRVRVM